ncbi:unnamed protein product [Blepharisma stoltei]|uniref:PhoD-like phosphatase metallophosphatase domain-containing protein n=1 Tax=Blepharisma stoltei TaxID=1481888 RepID=A0AAU9IID4_9CILI|nr:unnamed protein product [Blepharisma stoltei]
MALLLWLIFTIYKATALLLTVGSCAGLFGASNPDIWKSIKALNPDAFIWLGDAIYADQMILPLVFRSATEEEWKKKYATLKNAEGYKELRESIRILGVWDDHDYGKNNENKYYPYKSLSKELFLDFIDEPKNSIRYQREGIYDSYDFIENGKKIKVILLDDRTYLDPPGPDSDNLGEIQWEWLKNELDDKADLYLVMNGLQINVEDRITVTEKWFEKGRKRMLDILDSKPGVILVTGDVHHSEILKIDCYSYPIYEIVSSGLTHSVNTQYGFLTSLYLEACYPFTYNIGSRIYDRSFASIEISNDSINIDLRDSFGSIQLHHSLKISDLFSHPNTPYFCYQSIWERRIKHWASILLVYVIPFLTNISAFYIWVKKYSKSY